MTKKKIGLERVVTLRETLRSMQPGMKLEKKVDRPSQIKSIHQALAHLNNYEPDLPVKFSGQSLPAECKIIITARKREK